MDESGDFDRELEEEEDRRRRKERRHHKSKKEHKEEDREFERESKRDRDEDTEPNREKDKERNRRRDHEGGRERRKEKRRERGEEAGDLQGDTDDIYEGRDSQFNAPPANKEPPRKDEEVLLWNIALKQQQVDSVGSEERSILFIGGKESGKTTVIYRCLDKEEAPKSTVALEYIYGRRARANKYDKDVAHVWEIGGGTWLSNLIDVVITPENISTMSLALVLDLSKPEEMWITLSDWLKAVQRRVEAVLEGCGHSVQRQLRECVRDKYPSDHQDLEMLTPLPIPFVIIASKYDQFQNFETDKRKVICKTLRFIAHRYGAHLQFFSHKNEPLLNKTKAIVSSFLFNTAFGKVNQTDHSKPLMVTAGLDT